MGHLAWCLHEPPVDLDQGSLLKLDRSLTTSTQWTYISDMRYYLGRRMTFECVTPNSKET
ncbi:hypothetical protein JI435_403410 [Parastagonospora nodorum SN15]|uniref:Uncharacterized protein n=1 Tax=Phaeosphaeria nodorum (strain SN15 / ATCC MYA-4574 / FGSC 10173) TaxID=321614 RepID=A0A7U2HWN8_PHANO|nr:hypothetical protein JI435_403410 [Parastagonospora nodorum SN15]